MTEKNTFTLVNSKTGSLAFKMFFFEDNSYFDHLQRLNYYSLIWIKNGTGKVKADFATYDFTQNTLFSFAPFQPFMFQTNELLNGVAINFHSDFFCILKHHHEVACNGVLFNNIYTAPFIKIDESTQETFEMLIKQIKTEMQNPELAQNELLVSYLKIFLITASRLKKDQIPVANSNDSNSQEPSILQNLKAAIEVNYKTKHKANDYAVLLNISSKALAKTAKKFFNKTLTDLISERIIIEAKRELYLTSKSVKQIAYELGYDDEHYFSRFFKIKTDVSPQFFRESVGFVITERNGLVATSSKHSKQIG